MRTPKHWVEFTENWRWSPMAYWVHIEQDGKPWSTAERYEPPAPSVVSRKGFPVLCIEIEDTVLRFSARAQLEEFIRVLSLKPLPSSLRLSRRRGLGTGPNTHWLSRLPAKIKSPRMRSKVVAAVAALLAENGA